jgi:hypothetical protein
MPTESTETVESTSRPGTFITLRKIGLGARNRIILELAVERSKHRGLQLEWKAAGGTVDDKGIPQIPETIPDDPEDKKRSKLLDIQEQMTIASETLAIATAKQVVTEIRGPNGEVPLADVFEYDADALFAYELLTLSDERLGMRAERQKNSPAVSTSFEAEPLKATTTTAETASEENFTPLVAV